MASTLFQQFATNRSAEVEGVWVTFGGDESFKLARMGSTNKRYQQLIEAAMKKHKLELRNDTLSSEVDKAITLDAFLKTVLVTWKGIVVPELFGDDEAPYSYENGKKLMEALPELYANLREQATSLSNFRMTEIEADTKA